VTPTRAARSPSLLTRLLTVIVGPLIVLAVLLAVGSAYLIQSLTERTSDRVLLGSLTAIAETLATEDGEITLDLPAAAFGMLEDAERDNVYYSVRHDSKLLTGYRDLPSIPAARLVVGQPQLRNERFRGASIRVAALAKRLPRVAEPVVVQVAETMTARNKLQARLATVLVVLVALLVAGAALLVPLAIAWGLKPLDQLRREVGSRQFDGPVDLSPVALGGAPREIRPFIGAFNTLLQHLEDFTASMRRFTADASHQMRTPLAVLKTHLALARFAGSDERQRSVALEEVDAAASRLERLLAQLLSLARAEEQGRGAPLVAVDLSRLATEAVAERTPQAVAAGIDISFEAEEGGSLIALANPFLLGEVMTNLIDNAIRYNRQDGHVVVRVRRDRGTPRVEIQDDGPGIPEQERSRVLQRFARLQRDSDRAGTGLGLAIVHTLVSRMDGHIEMRDALPDGRGLLVVLELKAATGT
jgi:two-component system sensor histidine kinase TctE